VGGRGVGLGGADLAGVEQAPELAEQVPVAVAGGAAGEGLVDAAGDHCGTVPAARGPVPRSVGASFSTRFYRTSASVRNSFLMRRRFSELTAVRGRR